MTRRWKTRAEFLDPLETVHVAGDWELLVAPMSYDLGGGLIYTIAPYLLSDGTSRPWFTEWLVGKGDTKKMGFLHDDARGRLKTTNFFTDGLLFDAALAETGRIHTALAAWLGVRIGTHSGYKGAPPGDVVLRAMEIVAAREACHFETLSWNPIASRIHLNTQKPQL